MTPLRLLAPDRRRLSSWLLQAALLPGLLFATGTALEGQAGAVGASEVAAPVDTSDVVGAARAAQARFERRRVRLLPIALGGFGDGCDETVGRICVRFGEGEWYPRPERPEIVTARRVLLAELDSLQRSIPGEPWILGQRVWYRMEAGEGERALEVARRCGGRQTADWWCHALEGFVLHGLGRYLEAEDAFGRALASMDGTRAARWTVPRWSVDGSVRDLLAEDDGAGEGVEGHRPSRLLDRFWALSDPLWLVPGNDRRSAHFARWTATEIRDGARNPFRLPWGEDLTELTVRHGWQEGWERVPARSLSGDDYVIGHDHPLGRDYLPSGEALEAPARAGSEALRPRVRSPRSLYAPRYAPVLLPMEGQLALFPRGDSVLVVASHFLPEDTTFHAGHRHPRPWLDAGDQADAPDRIGLFAMTVDGTVVQGSEVEGAVAGALSLELPATDHVVSVESWSPRLRRAGRQRRGVRPRPVVPDIAVLSDLILLEPGPDRPETLEAALPRLLPRARLMPGQPVALAWEVAGLGFDPETLDFQLFVERAERDVFHRIGDFLGLSTPPRPLSISWQEAGPEEPGHIFRYLELELPPLESGAYEIHLVLRTAGRADVTAVLPFEVAAGA